MINSRDIAELHPAAARGCREFIGRMRSAGYPNVGISATYRDKTYQDWLYAQGRTRPGSIVTNAKGGQSIHNYRLAFDFFRNEPGQTPDGRPLAFADKTAGERAFWDTAGRIWTEMGGVWGGSWQGFVDRPHCEFTGGLSLGKLQAGRLLAADVKMPWEANIKQPEEVEEVEKRYDYVGDMPPWAQGTVHKLVGNGFLNGDEQGRLNLSADMLRLLVVNDRAGVYRKDTGGL